MREQEWDTTPPKTTNKKSNRRTPPDYGHEKHPSFQLSEIENMLYFQFIPMYAYNKKYLHLCRKLNSISIFMGHMSPLLLVM
jgi:hypothetical protein